MTLAECCQQPLRFASCGWGDAGSAIKGLEAWSEAWHRIQGSRSWTWATMASRKIAGGSSIFMIIKISNVSDDMWRESWNYSSFNIRAHLARAILSNTVLQRLYLGRNPQLSADAATAIANAVSSSNSLTDLDLTDIQLKVNVMA